MSVFTIWGLTDGSAGMVSQVRGVGEALVAALNNPSVKGEAAINNPPRERGGQRGGGDIDEKSLPPIPPVNGGGKRDTSVNGGDKGSTSASGGDIFVLKKARRIRPFCWLPGNWHWGALSQLTQDSDALGAPYPDLLISSGRRSVALALAIKKASGGKTKLVHLQGPRVALHHFDLVVPMEHDELKGTNVFPTFAALHHVTKEKLAAAARAYAATLAAMPKPRVLFLIGGSTHAYRLTTSRMQKMIESITAFSAQHEGSLWVTTSRRTGDENTALLAGALASCERVNLYRGSGDNPYMAWLASTDMVIVTNDSVNMMSEAVYTGKPVYILPLPEHHDTKPAAFADQLIARGYAKPFTLPLAAYAPQSLDEREGVVSAIIQRVITSGTNE